MGDWIADKNMNIRSRSANRGGYKFTRIKHKAGLVVFPDAAEIDQDFLEGWIERRSAFVGNLEGKTDRRLKTAEEFTIDEDGNYINRGGYKFTPEQFNTTPLRLVGLLYDAEPEDKAFVEYLDSVLAMCLEEYMVMYPEIRVSIWYRTPSHAAIYSEGHSLGPHSDQAVERGDSMWGYGPADENDKPVNEFPTKTVVTGSIILKDTAEGGSMYFPHAEHKEKFPVGTVAFYPSSYIGSHSVETVTNGDRVSYLQFYCQGTPIDGQSQTHVDAWRNKEGDWVPPVHGSDGAPSSQISELTAPNM